MLVQLDLRHTASRAMTSGVLRFAAAHRDLEVQFTSCEPNDYYRAWKPNALIIDASSQTCTRETLTDFYLLADVRACVGFIVDKNGFTEGDAEQLADVLKKAVPDYVVLDSKK